MGWRDKKFCSHPQGLSFFIVNTVFKSSTVSMWPVYLLVSTLPVKVCMNSSNIILAGLWVGPTKPPVKLLLDPVISILEHIKNESFEILILGRNIALTGQLIIEIFYLPVKASVLCLMENTDAQEYRCSICLHPGKHLFKVYLPIGACTYLIII